MWGQPSPLSQVRAGADNSLRGGMAGSLASDPASYSTHISRMRQSRSAGDLGLGVAPLTAGSKVLQSTATSSQRQAAWRLYTDGPAASRAARRRRSVSGGGTKSRAKGGGLATNGSTGQTMRSKSRIISAVQELDESSKATLLGLVQLERENRTAREEDEQSLQQLRDEAELILSQRDDSSSSTIFESLDMLSAAELPLQIESSKQILQFCASAPLQSCPNMLSRVAQVLGRVAGPADSSLEQERKKWAAKDAKAKRKHKEELSRVGKQLAGDFAALNKQKAELDAECVLLRSTQVIPPRNLPERSAPLQISPGTYGGSCAG